MADLRLITYCGLYCGLCSQHNRLPRQAAALRETMLNDGWEFFGGEIPGFSGFWEFLGGLAGSESDPRCREGRCGPPFCAIRECAQARGVEVCPFCDDYPCHRIEALGQGYPTLVADGRRMRTLGLDRWIEEQEARRATGFAYADIRCTPFNVPDD